MKIPETATRAERDLIKDEGWRNQLYEDSKGILSIGIGRNLEDRGLSDDEVMYLFRNDLRSHTKDAETLPYFYKLNPVRREAVINMIFNLGLARFLGFHRMNAAFERDDYETAADEAKDSKWYRDDVPRSRSERIIHMIRTGRRPNGR